MALPCWVEAEKWGWFVVPRLRGLRGLCVSGGRVNAELQTSEDSLCVRGDGYGKDEAVYNVR